MITDKKATEQPVVTVAAVFHAFCFFFSASVNYCSLLSKLYNLRLYVAKAARIKNNKMQSYRLLKIILLK